MRKKKKALLTIELSLLTGLILTLMLFFISLIYLIHIKESVRNAMSEAAKSYSTEIYLYSKLNQDLGLDGLGSQLNSRASKELGLQVNLTELASEALFSNLLERKCYSILGFQGHEPPFWLDGRIRVKVKAKSNQLYITSRLAVKLPVLSLFLKNIELEIKNVEAARGAEIALTGLSTQAEAEKNGGDRCLVLCQNSLNNDNPHPVYHDSKCFGRLWEKEENSVIIDKAKARIDGNGDLHYEGRVYHYCQSCKMKRTMEGQKDE